MISALTIVKNRERHLANLVEGLRRSTPGPAELVIVDMSDDAIATPECARPVSMVRHQVAGLPLAQARNLAAAHSRSDKLLFLDVDCIPAAGLCGAMDAALDQQDALICAEIRYLGPQDVVGGSWRESDLLEVGQPHPARTFPSQGLRLEGNAGLFWSLAFGISRRNFERLGGFDEAFEGYGGEDTDFGFRAREAGVGLYFLGGSGAFHQYHGVVDPPLHHFADIVRNAKLFKEKWGIWPMEGWLAAFAQLGLIKRSANTIHVISSPTEQQLRDVRGSSDRRF